MNGTEPARARTGFLLDPAAVEHRTPAAHPERPDRIRAIARAVREARLIDSPDPFPEFQLAISPEISNDRRILELSPAGPADERWILTVHTPAHLEKVRQTCAEGGLLDLGDTPVVPASFDAGLRAVGNLLRCCDEVAGGRLQNAFAAVRPPGHHAEPDQAMGFCLFSNVAIAARYLQKAHGVGRISIVDFDVHHGNGTQASFWTDPTVQFISLHQDPRTCYPGSGYESETGEGAGRGTTLNLPFPAGSSDDDYRLAFESRVIPAIDAFRPEFLLISAGFDAHADDPLAQIELSDQAFGWMTRFLVEAANVHCGGKIVSTLEGGYNLAALGRSVVQHLIALAGANAKNG